MSNAARKFLEDMGHSHMCRLYATGIGIECSCHVAHIRRLLAENEMRKDYKKQLNDALEKIKEFEASFELYDDASMRAIRMWQDATGEESIWPDQAYLIVWLMDKVFPAIKAAKRYIYWMGKSGGKYFTSAPTEWEEKRDIKRAFLKAFEELKDDQT